MRTRMIGSARIAGLVCLVLCLQGLTLAQVTYNSVKSGAWTNARTWIPTGVPGALDTAIVRAGHTVGLSPTSQGIHRVRVFDLKVFGTLTATYPINRFGNSMVITTPNLFVDGNGEIRGEDAPGYCAQGGFVVIQASPMVMVDEGVPVPAGSDFASPFMTLPTQQLGPEFPTDPSPPPTGYYEIQGLVTGGDGGHAGGSVFVIHGGVNLSLPPGPTILNLGEVQGGRGRETSDGGEAALLGLFVENHGLVRGGNSHGAFAGSASVRAFGQGLSAIARNFDRVRGGDSSSGRADEGGNATVSAVGLAENDTVPLTQQGIYGGRCGGDAALFGNPTWNRGTIRSGTNPPGCRAGDVYGDPPDGTFNGNTYLYGENIYLRASDLTLGPFTQTPAIEAEGALEIVLATGGTLDLSSLVTGQVDAPGGVTIKADNVTLPPGITTLQQLLNTTVTLLPGESQAGVESWPERWSLDMTPGESLIFPYVIRNVGNALDSFTVSGSDTQGWMTPFTTTSTTLASMDFSMGYFQVNAPIPGVLGAETVVTIETTSVLDSNVSSTSRFTLRIPRRGLCWFGDPAPTNCGTPDLDASGLPQLGNNNFALLLNGLCGPNTSALFYGFQTFDPPFEVSSIGGQPGSLLYVWPMSSVPVFSPGGTATLPLAIPNDGTLLGAIFYFQDFDLDLSLYPPFTLPLGNSRALEMTILL